jgi:hypothetical protein
MAQSPKLLVDDGRWDSAAAAQLASAFGLGGIYWITSRIHSVIPSDVMQ